MPDNVLFPALMMPGLHYIHTCLFVIVCESLLNELDIIAFLLHLQIKPRIMSTNGGVGGKLD